ncbi:MAG: hypothetical protein IKH04_08600 [Kiritimatiellae bacterium]|nr:hypothetical protein [Kiritimatiellia bacterium]
MVEPDFTRFKVEVKASEPNCAVYAANKFGNLALMLCGALGKHCNENYAILARGNEDFSLSSWSRNRHVKPYNLAIADLNVKVKALLSEAADYFLEGRGRFHDSSPSMQDMPGK